VSILSVLERSPDGSPNPSRSARPPRPSRVRRDAPHLPAVVGADLLVPVLDGQVVGYANLDHAASPPCLEPVKRAVDATLETYGSCHRGSGHASAVTTRWFEEAREELRRFTGARPDDAVVFTRHATESLNLLAKALPAGTTVFVWESEHHAALLPWTSSNVVRLPTRGQRDPGDLAGQLGEALVGADADHALVVVTAASNVTGELWPTGEITETAHRHGARVCVDASQLAPHRQLDVTGADVDYLVLSGHKIYAPFGSGLLVGRPDWLQAAEPHLRGGGATDRVTAESVAWSTGAARHEAGSPNVVGAVAMAAAASILTRHREAVRAHEDFLLGRLRDGLAAIDAVQTYSFFAETHDRVGIATFTLDGLRSEVVSAALSAEHGIGLRDGRFCAHLLVDRLLGSAGRPDGNTSAVRASIGLGTTLEHVDRLVDAMTHLANDGPAASYDCHEGVWSPRNDPRDLRERRPW
jgi:selenocysteine lyase/cysteine desulfurase